MPLSVKDPDVERLVAELAQTLGMSKTAVIRDAVQEKASQLRAHENVQRREAALLDFLQAEIWPLVPAEQRGAPLSKAEREEILGIGHSGV